MAIVYLHRRGDNNEIFYVGIENEPKRAYEIKNRTNKHWKNIVKNHGILVEIIENDLSWEDACIMERELIKKYGRIDLKTGTLVNLTDGGDGQSNPSPETRKKLRYKRSEENKQKLRTYRSGVKQSNETIEKRIKSGFHKKEEYRKKMSKSLSGDNNPMKKECNKQKLRKKKPPRTEEHSRKISEAKKGKTPWNKGKVLKKYICRFCGKEIGGTGNLLQHENKHSLN